tara:strand:- start:98 stop:472 length:375 start_codon:yes stop_codon:yes gene_type:complete
MTRYAVIENSVVTNVIVGLATTAPKAGAGATVVGLSSTSLVGIGASYIDGEFIIPPVVIVDSRSTDEKWSDFREIRNRKLSKTDWRASSDLVLSDEWKNYRKALRDLPASTSDPANPTWPTPPS